MSPTSASPWWRGKITETQRAPAEFGRDSHLTAGLAREAVDHRQAEPGVQRPSGLVVKNGSKARRIVSGVMPMPVSVTLSDTYSPGGQVAGARRRLVEVLIGGLDCHNRRHPAWRRAH